MAKKRPILKSRLNLRDVVGIDLANEEKPLFARGVIEAALGSHKAKLEKDYYWNGANNPRLMWSILGVSPYDPRVMIASGFHDAGCESDEVPQAMADATFVALLGPIEFNGVLLPGVGPITSFALYVGVRFYSIFVRPIRRLLERLRKNEHRPQE